ncbi:hypothetical protein A2X44_03005 [candidate division CPR3 bacterium GWF2_35_18]|uniref:Peptidase M50 n=1 Tax=candidate division CPR3 bacterium GW2011_GWF2_35_18 TaxID=1618350 RepID=A0A0G0BJ02_UNCC3|nr:MAG: Peptidase M50 [candidate division CPR3 bacterium GW2011_GWF2_35_18]OGB62947.1 MAG: hypothetical protein A2X44_03005 [candidate division CPR3 bacterium GWF2_35_18]OGB65927.1 MAG: hypothetical protein A2250_03385 [candidate division CPR3 bacterium RIFOXYA2_FULL_35_13]OGB76765.1 MAG: hypothetical protein A2476_05090 [candidate division CPR3 bacterium RIFOXYC2_FULL_35_7]
MFLNTALIIPYILFFIPALIIHEFSHAYIADKLGDPTPKAMGRLTINPFAHLDLVGTLAIFLIGFGWAKPVPINPYNFKNIRRDTALVSLAGPAANFALAILGLIILYFIGNNWFLEPFILINIVLGTFNLIPLGPLDGFKIVSGILPTKMAIQWEESSKLTYILLIILLILPINGQTVISMYLQIILDLLSKLFPAILISF